jgi:hypothetical protein
MLKFKLTFLYSMWWCNCFLYEIYDYQVKYFYLALIFDDVFVSTKTPCMYVCVFLLPQHWSNSSFSILRGLGLQKVYMQKRCKLISTFYRMFFSEILSISYMPRNHQKIQEIKKIEKISAMNRMSGTRIRKRKGKNSKI